MWKEEKIIEDWRTARIFPIHKGGDKSILKNYRGVFLLDLGYKVLTTIMNNRLRDWLEANKCWKESQAGFRQGRSTRDHIFTLKSIVGDKLKRK